MEKDIPSENKNPEELEEPTRELPRDEDDPAENLHINSKDVTTQILETEEPSEEEPSEEEPSEEEPSEKEPSEKEPSEEEPLVAKPPEEFVDEGEEKPKSQNTYLFVGIFAAIAIVAFGWFGHALDAGWFFYRSILYSSGELYALNLSEKPLWVSVDGAAPLVVNPNDARIMRLMGGSSKVEVRENKSGEVKQTYEIETDHSNAFLKLTQDGCLVAVDLTPFYGGGSGKEKEIIFTDKVKKEDQIWIPNSYNVIWPRKTFPKQLSRGDGPGRWIELVACTLLEDTDDDKRFLEAYIALRLQERMKKALGTGQQSGQPR